MSHNKDVVCRGCWAMGTACGLCSRCIETRPAAPPLVPWMLCANDRHGNFTGAMERASFDVAHEMVEMEGPEVQLRWAGDLERVRFGGAYRAAPMMLKVYGRGRLPVWRHIRWVGNIYWDHVGLAVPYVLALLRWLSLAGWSVTAAPTPVYDAWHDTDARAVTADDFGAAMLRAMEASS